MATTIRQALTTTVLLTIIAGPDLANRVSLVTARTCGFDLDDLPSRTVQSLTVFRGKVTTVHGPVVLTTLDGGGQLNVNNVTLSVLKVFKDKLEQKLEQKSNGSYGDVLVGTFAQSVDGERCLAGKVAVGAEIIVFINTAGAETTPTKKTTVLPSPRYYVMSTLPVVANAKNVKEVEAHSCPKCVVNPVVELPKNPINVKVGQKIDLTCKKKGKPPPRLTWTKNDQPLAALGKIIQITNSKRNSRLVIGKAKEVDSGDYRCHGVSAAGNASSRIVKINVNNVVSDKVYADLCKEQTYCLNGGTCSILKALNITFCICSNDFTGGRCTEKVIPIELRTGENIEATFHISPLMVLTITGAATGCIAVISICIFLMCHLCDRSEKRLKKNQPSDQQQQQQPNQIHVRSLTADSIVCEFIHTKKSMTVCDKSVETDAVDLSTLYAGATVSPAATFRPNGNVRSRLTDSPVGRSSQSNGRSPRAQHKENLPLISESQTFNRNPYIAVSTPMGAAISTQTEAGGAVSTQLGATVSTQAGFTGSIQRGVTVLSPTGATVSTQAAGVVSTQAGRAVSTQAGAADSIRMGATAPTNTAPAVPTVPTQMNASFRTPLFPVSSTFFELSSLPPRGPSTAHSVIGGNASPKSNARKSGDASCHSLYDNDLPKDNTKTGSEVKTKI